MTNTTRIGWIGLGGMGSLMAKRLLDAGFPLTVYNREPEKAKQFAQAGAEVAAGPRELAARSDIVLSSLTNDAAVEEVYLGAEGVLAGARAGALIVEMSTILPKTARAVAEAAKKQGVGFVDAPVSGSTPQAEAGQLTILAGGDEADFERAGPLFDAIGKAAFRMGPVGAGAAMKLVVNTLLGLGLQSLGEALALGKRAGLERGQLLDVLAQTAHVSPGQKAKMENVRKGEYPPQFPVRLLHKDFGLVLDQATALNVAMPITAAAQQMFSIQAGRDGDADCSAVIQLMLELTQSD